MLKITREPPRNVSIFYREFCLPEPLTSAGDSRSASLPSRRSLWRTPEHAGRPSPPAWFRSRIRRVTPWLCCSPEFLRDVVSPGDPEPAGKPRLRRPRSPAPAPSGSRRIISSHVCADPIHELHRFAAPDAVRHSGVVVDGRVGGSPSRKRGRPWSPVPLGGHFLSKLGDG